jgi:hypothetical protein
MKPRVWILLLALLASCATDEPWRPVVRPWTTEVIGEREDARALLRNGTLIELENARIVLNPWGSFLAGDDRDERRRQVDLDSIDRLESRRQPPERFSEYSEATQLILVVLAFIVGALVWNNASTY